MLIARVQEMRIGAQCRESAYVSVPVAILQRSLRGSFVLQ
jgi:hypothetical protein